MHLVMNKDASSFTNLGAFWVGRPSAGCADPVGDAGEARRKRVNGAREVKSARASRRVDSLACSLAESTLAFARTTLSCADPAGSGGSPVRGGWVLPQMVAPKRR